MPIAGIGSYRTTMAAFDEHWTLSNAALTPVNVILTGNYTLASFQADEAQVNAAIEAVGPLAQSVADLAFQRDVLKSELRARVLQYRGVVAGQLAGSVFASRAPLTPNPSDGYDAFFKSLNAMKEDWTQINALSEESAATHRAVGFVGPLILQGGYGLAQFETAVGALQTLWPQSESKAREASQARDNRNALLAPIRERMKQYREILPALLPKNSPLLASLPRLSPPAGQTPPSAGAVGAWDAALQMAHFTVPVTTSAKVAYRSLRVTPGPKYSADDEVTVLRVENDQTEASTLEALGNPGAVASYKMYSVGPDGNENGGKAMTIVRPVG